MARVEITDLFVYRWRYIAGYTLIGLLLAALLVFVGLFVPGGLSAGEMAATVQSHALSWQDPSSLLVANAPYYALQSLIFTLFGVSIFTIKLPSLILALFSAIGLIMLLRRWFTRNIAVLASLIAVTTGQFLFIAQNGTPGVLYLFWPVVLLLLGTLITRGHRFRALWKILFTATAAMSLYTPLSVYPLIAIIIATVLHPHLRSIVRRLSVGKVSLALAIAGLIVTPLIIGIVTNPQLGLSLLGIPSAWPPDLLANLQTLFNQYLNFWEPSAGALMTPVFGLGSTLLIILGLYRLIRTHETTRSYLIIAWLILLLPVLILNPAFTTVSYLPSVLLLAAGLTSLIGYWYRLFPFNPYARAAGLIPIVVLVIALIGSGVDRYFYGYWYDPRTAVHFSRDLALLPKETQHLVVADDQRAFYDAVAHYNDDISIVSTAPTSDTFVSTKAARQAWSGYTIDRIIVDGVSSDADRFYIYKKITE